MSYERHLPRIITAESRAAEAAQWFERRYSGLAKDWKFVDGKSPHAIIAQLKSLGRPPTAREVRDIIGDSWVTVTCDACCDLTEWAVEVGQPPDYESRTAVLCRRCLGEAAALLVTP